MTQEEIQKYADKLGQEYFPNECNIWARENLEAKFVSEACVRMAKYIEQELIKEACEWIKNNKHLYKELSFGSLNTGDKFIREFGKAMKGGTE